MFVNACIETNRLIIRPYQLEDVDRLFEVVSEPNFYQYVPEDIPTKEDVKKGVQWSIGCCEKNTADKIQKFNLSMIHKADNTLIGYCGLGPYDLNDEEVEIYYGISAFYRGKGLAYEAAQAVLDYGFYTIGLQRIVTTVSPNNTPSVRILQKLGMKHEYRLRNMSSDYKYFEGFDYYSISKKGHG